MQSAIKFGTDGWRAIIAQEFTVENVARLTYGLSHWVKRQDMPQRIVIGYDCRFGGKLFCRAAATVLLSEGIEVLFADRIVTTPMLALAARDLSCAAGLMMTASHNSASYQGYKLKTHLGGPMGGAPLREIEAATPEVLPSNWEIDSIEEHVFFRSVDIETPYAEAIASAFDLDSIRRHSKSIAYDAMYGSGQFVMRKLFPDIDHFRSEHNPTFHGINPEPIARNLQPFSEYLLANDQLTFGLVNDGDADRIGLMNAKGQFIDSQHIILLLIHYLVKYKGLKGKVVTAFSTVDKVRQLCDYYELPLEVVKIGFKYASEVMVKEPVMLAGEESGGIAVDTHIPERDGIWIGLMLMEFLALTGKDLDELIQEVYAIVGPFVYKRNDLRLSQKKKEAVIAACKQSEIKLIDGLAVSRVEDLDGWKFILESDAWLMIRPSGTEPVLRVYVDAATEEQADEIMDAALRMIEAY
jgi:phosphomannomutase